MIDQRSAFFGYLVRMLREEQMAGHIDNEAHAYAALLVMCKWYKIEPIDQKEFTDLYALIDYIGSVSTKLLEEIKVA